jgi:hypothetical protein
VISLLKHNSNGYKIISIASINVFSELLPVNESSMDRHPHDTTFGTPLLTEHEMMHGEMSTW